MTASLDGQEQIASDTFMSAKIDISRLALCLGLAIALAGVALLVYGINYEISVPGSDGSDRIINEGLTNSRMVITLAGAAAFVGGVTAAGTAWTVMTIQGAVRHLPVR